MALLIMRFAYAFVYADPESQRKRTVQNVLDLRQNLEETMTSLRGVQLSHRFVTHTHTHAKLTHPKNKVKVHKRSTISK